MSYPVVAEFWTILESVLETQARRLVDDIAKRQNADSKDLWSKIKPRIKIGLLDINTESMPTVCSHIIGSSDGAIRLRCRAPCVLGFDSCPCHIHTPQPAPSEVYKHVNRVYSHEGHTYFVDSNDIAYDKNGKPKGCIEEGVLCLFLFESNKNVV